VDKCCHDPDDYAYARTNEGRDPPVLRVMQAKDQRARCQEERAHYANEEKGIVSHGHSYMALRRSAT
jgi:hypothetical protein